MFTVSYTASEHLALMLAEANAPDAAVFRLIVKNDETELEIDTVQPGDTTFDHAEKTVLVIDEQVSELVADMKLDVKVTGEEPELVMFEPLEE